MRNIIISGMLLLMPFLGLAQDNVGQLIKEGTALYDKGDFNGSISKFDEALKIQPENDHALYEKSLSLIRLKQYDKAEELLKKVLSVSKNDDIRQRAYANYGTALDLDGKSKESLKVYNQGIKEYPDNNMIHFNKGITEIQLKDYDAATESFQESVRLNPKHASSHNALGRMVLDKSRIKGVLALFSFLLIEPESKRAEDNIKLLNNLIMKGVSRKDDKNVTISIDINDIDKKKKKEDDFSSAELMLSLTAASVPDSLKDRSEAEKLHHQLSLLISIIDESEKKDKGFFKNFYVPFLVAIKEKDMLETACYVALTSSGKDDIYKWQKENRIKVEDFINWVDEYKWGKD